MSIVAFPLYSWINFVYLIFWSTFQYITLVTIWLSTHKGEGHIHVHVQCVWGKRSRWWWSWCSLLEELLLSQLKVGLCLLVARLQGGHLGEGLESSPVVTLDVVQDAQSVVGVCVVGRVLENLLEGSACLGVVLQLVVESSKVGESICTMGSSR